MKFLLTKGGYATEFSKCNRYEVICKTLDEYLVINDLKMMKATVNNYFKATEVSFFAFFSTCMCEINNRIHATLCVTKIYIYKIFCKRPCQYITDNLNDCKHCVVASKALDTTDEFKRICNPENNEDYV